MTPDPLAPKLEALRAAAGRAFEWLQLGGPVVVILLAMSVLALTVAIAKFWQFRAQRLGDLKPARTAIRLYRAGRPDAALALAESARNPVADTLARALRGQRDGVPEARIRDEVFRHADDVLESLRSGFRTLEVVSSLAPLLGLFGTVLGMIDAFRRLEEAGRQVDPAILSGGIWEALLTTAVGLAVAMPAVALLNWFEGRVDRVAHEIDSIVGQVFTEDLSAEADAAASHATDRIRRTPRLAGE